MTSDLNLEFSFFLPVFLINVKEPILLYYLPVAGGRKLDA